MFVPRDLRHLLLGSHREFNNEAQIHQSRLSPARQIHSFANKEPPMKLNIRLDAQEGRCQVGECSSSDNVQWNPIVRAYLCAGHLSHWSSRTTEEICYGELTSPE